MPAAQASVRTGLVRQLGSILYIPGVAPVIGFAMVLMLGQGMVLPVLPLYARSFGVGYEGAGILVTAFYAARLAGDLVAGPVVERWGEGRPAVVGLAALSLGALVTAYSPYYAAALVAWAVAGAGSSIIFASLYNRLLAVVPSASMGRALSLFYAAFNGGLIGGGFIGGLVAARFGLAAPLFMLAAAGVALTPVAALALGWAVRRPAHAEAVRLPLLRLLRVRGVMASVLAILAYLWMVGAIFNTLTPLFAHYQLGASTAAIGIVYAVALTTELVVLFPAGSWSDRYGRRWLLISALAAVAAISLVIGRAGNIVELAALMGMLGIASGIAGVPPAAILADSVSERERPLAVAAFRFGGDIGLTAGPLMAGLTVSAFGFGPAFALTAVPIALALVAVFVTPETLKRAPEAAT